MKYLSKARFLFFVTTIAFLSSCSSERGKTAKNISIVITDSINVDYLGDLNLKGYNPQSDQYLLTNMGMTPILEVDAEGRITRDHAISQDGPDAIPQPGSLGYVNGNLTIYDMQAGYFTLNTDNRLSKKLVLPYPHSYLVFPPHLPLIEWSEESATYVKPLEDSDFIDGMGEKFFRNYYSKALIERLDLRSGTVSSHMEIPSGSMFRDGQNHGIYIPVIKKKGNQWLLSTWFDPFLYVYEEQNGDLQFVKAVDLGLDDLIAYEPVAMENSEAFFDKNADIRAGNINDILWLEDYIVVVYRKGLDKNTLSEINQNYPAETNVEIEKQDPFYAVILDKSFNLIAKDVNFPYGIHYPNVVNTANEIVSLKHPALFDVEENFITLYKMKLQMD